MSSETNRGFSAADVLDILNKHRYMILTVTFCSAVMSVLVTFILPKVYTSTAVIMPPQQDQSGATAMLGQLISGGAGGGGGSIGAILGLKNPNDLYVGILGSRSIADNLINRFKLRELYGTDVLQDLRKQLEEKSSITATRDGLIKIEFEDTDPKRAAAIANAYVEELERMTAQLAISDASRRRIYFQKKVDEALVNLGRADSAFKTVQEKTGLIKPDDQAKAIFDVMATLRGRIAEAEVELAAMGAFATKQNADYIRTEQVLASMKRQLAGLERDNRLGDGNILVPTGKVPAAGLEFIEKWREVKHQEAVYEVLVKQLELAKMDEGKNATIIQFVDRAVASDKSSKPKKAFIVILSTLLAGILATVWAFQKEMRNPEYR
jgi:tyrosine-protein kinase Etk/Wzc